MKTFATAIGLVAIAVLVLSVGAPARAGIVAYDGFEAGGASPGAGQYETGTGFGSPGDALVAGIGSHTMQGPDTTGFSAANPWQNAGFITGDGDYASTVYYQASETDMTYMSGPNLLDSLPGSVRHLHEATPADKDIHRTIVDKPTPGNLSYYSFLLRYESEDNNWESSARLGVEQGASQSQARYTSVGINTSGELFAYESRNGTSDVGPLLTPDQNHLVVVRLEELPGIPDSMHAWLDPALDAEPALSSADLQITGDYIYVGNNSGYTFDTLGLTARLSNDGASSPEDFVFFDEFRLGTTYADVTPYATVLPEPSALALAFLGLAGMALFGRRRRRRET